MHDEPLGRRAFVSRVGKGVLGIAVLGVTACAGDPDAATTTSGGAGSGTTSAATAATRETTATPTTVPATEGPGDPPPSTAGVENVAVQRVDLGFVSAYIVVRGTEAAIVDTGVSGSAGAIEESLSDVGLGWSDVGHVVLTHLHPDHVGSLPDVLEASTDALAYAGHLDLPRISSPRPISGVGAGDSIFGLDIIDTPGHTAGHIAVFEPLGRILIAGDALNGAGASVAGADEAGLAGPNPRFTSDMETAMASVRVLAALEPLAIYFGHGVPLLDGAAEALATI